MHSTRSLDGLGKEEAYRELNLQLASIFEGEKSGLANAANMAALIFHSLPDLNWVGFYFMQDGELVLGPFQGRVACVRIAVGKGVCGTAAQKRESVVVPDVDAFPGHIVCDSASRSEIVVPLVQGGRIIGVLDVDSPSLARFDADDRKGMEAGAALLLRASDFERLVD